MEGGILTLSETMDTTSKEFRINLEKEIDKFHRVGIPICLYNNKGKPMNVPNNTDLLNYTVEDSINAITDNVNGWKNWGLHDVYGIYLLTGKIKSGKLKNKYIIGIETDTEKAYEAFLNGSTIEEIVNKYKWVIHLTEPYYKIHIFIIVDKLEGFSFLNENNIVNHQTKETLGLAVFTEGKWFAVSPSVNHRSKYPWKLFENGDKVINVTSDENLADLKERINHVCKTIGGFEYGEQKKNKNNSSSKEYSKFTTIPKEQSEDFDETTANFIKYIVNCFTPYYKEGSRDQIVFHLSGYFGKEGINIKVTQEIVETLQQKHNQKPNLKPDEIEIIGSRLKVIINSYQKVDKREKVEGYSAFAAILNKESLEELKQTVTDYKRFYNSPNRIQDIYELAVEHIIEKYPCLTLTEDLEKEKPKILVYENGCYRKKSIKKIIQDEFSYDFKRYEKNEISDYIKYKNVVDREDIDTDLHLINVKNGMYNFKTKKLLPHDPKYLSLIQIPIEYDPTKKCPNFIKFINESVSKSDIDTLLDSLAYIFSRKNVKEIINFLVGEGYNGKTLLILVMTHILGRENVSNVSLKRIVDYPYVEASMLGKLVNFAPDTKTLSVEDEEKLKIIFGKQRQTVEAKYLDSFESLLNIKPFFPINRIGHISDDSDGTHRRFNYYTFPQKYKDELTEEEENDPIQEYKLADTELESKLIAEASGIFSLLMDRLDKLEERNFKFGRSANENRERYELLKNKIRIFVDGYIEFREIDHTKKGYRQYWEYKDTVFDALDKFCKEKEIPTPSKDALGKSLKTEIEKRFRNQLTYNDFQYEGKRVRETTGKKLPIYFGIKLLNEEERERREQFKED